MSNLIVDVEDGMVTVIPVSGYQEEFQAAAAKLVKSGVVSTVTGPTGIALRTDFQTAKKAGLVKAARSGKKA